MTLLVVARDWHRDVAAPEIVVRMICAVEYEASFKVRPHDRVGPQVAAICVPHWAEGRDEQDDLGVAWIVGEGV